MIQQKSWQTESPLQSWEGRFISTDKNGVRFLDPVYNEPLEPLTPPRSVLEDLITGPGLQALQRLSRDKDVTIHLVLGMHGNKQHFDDIAAQHGDILQNARYVGVEANWQPVLAGGMAPYADHRIILDPATGRRQFQQQQLSWLKQHGVKALPCEFAHGYNTPLTQNLGELLDAYANASDGSYKPGKDVAADNHFLRVYSTYAYQCTRHSLLPGVLGAWLNAIDKTGDGLRQGEAIPLILGSWHRPTKERLERLGVNCLASTTRHSGRRDRYGPIFIKTVANARISHKDAAVPLPF